MSEQLPTPPAEIEVTKAPATEKALKGRSPLGVKTGEHARRAEWNRPNRKAAAKLARRQSAWEKAGSDSTGATHKPGSLKIG